MHLIGAVDGVLYPSAWRLVSETGRGIIRASFESCIEIFESIVALRRRCVMFALVDLEEL